MPHSRSLLTIQRSLVKNAFEEKYHRGSTPRGLQLYKETCVGSCARTKTRSSILGSKERHASREAHSVPCPSHVCERGETETKAQTMPTGFTSTTCSSTCLHE